jgi:hypothetical protein
MAQINSKSKETARHAGAIAIASNQGVEQQTFRMRKAMILLAIVMLGTAMATHAFAAGRMVGGLSVGVGFQGSHMSHGFQPQILNQTPAMPAPTFNPSNSYTVPQAPEVPVSPASPGSVFGNG